MDSISLQWGVKASTRYKKREISTWAQCQHKCYWIPQQTACMLSELIIILKIKKAKMLLSEK